MIQTLTVIGYVSIQLQPGSKQTKNCLSLPKQTEMRTSHCVEKYRAIVGEGVEYAVAVFGASCLHAHALSVCYIYDSLSMIIQ